jgi:hypothetical protein
MRSAAQRRARAACAARCACARHTPRGEVCQQKDGCIAAYHVPKPRSGPVAPRCMRYMMRRCGMRCACCTGARCVSHRFRVASEQYIALYVASTCRIDACCIGASARVASARFGVLHRRALHVASLRVVCCSGACCTLHFANSQPSRSARSCSPLCGVWCACADRLGEGRAFASAERRRDALVRSSPEACSPWPRAPRCSTPWRYPTPQHGCV